MSKAVQNMFSDIAKRYDITNDVLSAGTHRLWKKKAIQQAELSPGNVVLDLCTGTGDLALISAEKVGQTGKVVGLDFCDSMLELAKSKHSKLLQEGEALEQLEFISADASKLPFIDNSFDAVSIAFGIRNVDNPLRCLSEIRRVLKDGGRAIILEFGQPYLPGFSTVYRLYSKFIIPQIGKALTGNKEAYEYLPKTSKEFPAGEKFAEMMKSSGFHKPQVHPLFAGLAYIYKGEK